MMACANRDSFLIENRSDVVGMHMIKHKRKHAGFFLGGTDDSQIRRCSQSASVA